MIKSNRVIVLLNLGFGLMFGCSENISYDRNAAMREETLCAILNAGYRYDKGVHHLDNEAVKCSFFTSDDTVCSNHVLDIIIKQGWMDVSSNRLENGKYLGKYEWEFAFVKCDKLLLLRMDRKKLDVMIICNGK